jgi:hypothetical protein
MLTCLVQSVPQAPKLLLRSQLLLRSKYTDTRILGCHDASLVSRSTPRRLTILPVLSPSLLSKVQLNAEPTFTVQ